MADEIQDNDVANYFLAFANQVEELITNMKLQKLVYYAQAWYLANYGKPLFSADFEAWVHGPVIPDLYHEYKKFGYKPIIRDVSLKEISKKFGELESEFLDEVIEVYMPCGAYELERMTHLEEPWIAARVGYEPDDVCHVIIPKPAMREYYAKKLKADSAN